MRISINGDETDVEFIHEAFDFYDCDKFLIGHAFGPTHLVTADNMGDAEEAYLDRADTIPEEDIWEAYGFDSVDAYLAWNDREDPDDERELRDGYRWQGTHTGSGIVQVGLDYWIRQVKTELFGLTYKS